GGQRRHSGRRWLAEALRTMRCHAGRYRPIRRTGRSPLSVGSTHGSARGFLSTHSRAPFRNLRHLARLLLLLHRFHVLPQAQWTHVRPDFIYILAAFGARAFHAYLPAIRNRIALWPEGVLLLLIDQNEINRGVILVIRRHVSSSAESFGGSIVNVAS